MDWKQLGIQLKVPTHILTNIDRENPGNESRKLSAVLQYWVDNETASWEKIVEALQRIGGHANIITSVQSKYIISPPLHLIPQSTDPPVVSASSVAKEDVDHVITEILSLVEQLVRFPAELRGRTCTDAALIELIKSTELHDSPCTDDDLSQSITEWKDLSHYLRLSPKEVEKILEYVSKANTKRGYGSVMFRRWKENFGKNANYRYIHLQLLTRGDNKNRKRINRNNCVYQCIELSCHQNLITLCDHISYYG